MFDPVAVCDDIPLTINRSRRKTLVLHVTGQAVEVRAPINCPDSVIADFVDSKRAWILRTVAELSGRPTREPESFLAGSEHYYMGEAHVLDLVIAPRRFVEREGGRIII